MMIVLVSYLSSSKIAAFSFLSAGRKASNAKRLVEIPDKVRAVTQAAAPGKDVTSTPAS